MASIDDLQRKRRLEEERAAVKRTISVMKDRNERKALQRVLAKIELELENCKLDFPEAPVTLSTPILPDSSHRELMPSQRVKCGSSWNEGAPKRRGR